MITPRIKHAVERCAPKLARRARELHYGYLLATHRDSWLRHCGWLRSCGTREVVDDAGRPMPWMNYPAVELLRDRLSPGHRVFEFGCGYSTLFYASLAGSVTSVEHDSHWARKVRAALTDASLGATILEVPPADPDKYTAPLREAPSPPDVVVIDGRHRNACAAAAADRCGDASVILIDDSERASLHPGVALLCSRGYKRLMLRGPKPRSIHLHDTSFFYRRDNCLAL